MTESVTRKCPMCTNETTIEVDSNALHAWRQGLNIVEAFPKMMAHQREVLISGICFDCQERVFNRPLPEHEEEWGKNIGGCNCCGCPLYANRNISLDDEYEGQEVYKCPQCGTRHYIVNDDELQEIDEEDE